jgi:hypothetical protein
MYRYVQHLLPGTNHNRKGADSDDRAAVLDFQDEVVVAVADGAGSAPYGGLGAEVAVHAVKSSLQESFLPKSQHTPKFIRKLFRRARDRIVRLANQSGHVVHDYATTLIVVVVTPQMVTTGRIGDGCVVVATLEGEIELLSYTSRTGPTNVTQFLTDEDWLEQLTLDRLKKPNLSVAAFSDGIEYQVTFGRPRRPHLQFFEPIFRSMHSRGELRTGIVLNRVFQNQIAAVSGDDMTIVLASPEVER